MDEGLSRMANEYNLEPLHDSYDLQPIPHEQIVAQLHEAARRMPLSDTEKAAGSPKPWTSIFYHPSFMLKLGGAIAEHLVDTYKNASPPDMNLFQGPSGEPDDAL